MVITKELEEQFTPLLVEIGVIVTICMYCRLFLGQEEAEGAAGGFSHGLCCPICEAAKANGWK